MQCKEAGDCHSSLIFFILQQELEQLYQYQESGLHDMHAKCKKTCVVCSCLLEVLPTVISIFLGGYSDGGSGCLSGCSGGCCCCCCSGAICCCCSGDCPNAVPGLCDILIRFAEGSVSTTTFGFGSASPLLTLTISIG